MKSLVIIEHNNSELKILSLNTIKAAKLISKNVDALVIGYNHSEVVKEVCKADGLNKVFFVDDEFFTYCCDMLLQRRSFRENYRRRCNRIHV